MIDYALVLALGIVLGSYTTHKFSAWRFGRKTRKSAKHVAAAQAALA